MLAGFLLLLLLVGGSSYSDTEPDGEEEKCQPRYTIAQRSPECSYVTLVNHLNLTDKVKFAMTRPVDDHRKKTEVFIHLEIQAILDVIDKEQKFVSYVWLDMRWQNDFIKWDRESFCCIWFVSLPSELLWKPDIYIQEMTGKDKDSEIPYLNVMDNGRTIYKHAMVLESTCKMRFYKFPLDTQICNLTFRSITHFDKKMELHVENEIKWKIKPLDLTQSKSEWLLLDITVDRYSTSHLGKPTSMLVYSIKIKRRSLLYIVNFILPILFFLCLDLASFLISDSGGEKLGFKITVLLSVTVMQLILNEILPSSSDRIPLIAVYCIGTFSLMMMSLLETILVMYLMEKDSVSQDKDTEKDQSLKEDCTDKHGKLQSRFRDINKWVHSTCVRDVSLSETPSELLPVAKEGSCSRVSEECQLEKLSEELREVKLLLSIRKDEDKPGYWTRMTKRINRIYMIVYVITASLFLGVLFSRWVDEENN